ncbi:MAG: class I SAM-dependent methyltransferase [Candidatus Caenarcaniphilales bacterium]|nr:class I SAM-dependent methyltransferase [Candidatus Caenarcaniphilales bacterium]
MYDLAKSFDYENGFYYTCESRRIAKIIAHYELYKKIINLPGDVIEFGVFKGNSLIRLLAFREMLESQNSRKVIGFDTFATFPQPPKENAFSDQAFVNFFSEHSGLPYNENELKSILDQKNFLNYELVGGDIMNTLPSFLNSNPALKLSLVHIDVDIYEPAKFILDHICEHLVNGALIIFDDYNIIHGETSAVDEFLEKHKGCVIKKLPITHTACYCIWNPHEHN